MTWLLCASSFQQHLKRESEIWDLRGKIAPFWRIQDLIVAPEYCKTRQFIGLLDIWKPALMTRITGQLWDRTTCPRPMLHDMCKIISVSDYKCFQDTCFHQERNQHTNGQLDIVQREGVVVNPSVSTDSSTLEGNKFLVVSYSSTIVVLYPNL